MNKYFIILLCVFLNVSLALKRALIIGINYIDSYKKRLPGCINDGILIENMLINNLNFKKENIIFLRDDSNNTSLIPTKQNIIYHLHDLIENNEKYTDIWLHYSGHGDNITDYNGDEEDGYDEVILPSDYHINGYISDDELNNFISMLKRPTFITVDSCHSGTMFDLPYSFHINNNVIKRYKSNYKSIEYDNIYMLASSMDNEWSRNCYVKELKTYVGLFTFNFIQIIKSSSKPLTLIKLYKKLYDYFNIFDINQNVLLSSSNNKPFS